MRERIVAEIVNKRRQPVMPKVRSRHPVIHVAQVFENPASDVTNSEAVR